MRRPKTCQVSEYGQGWAYGFHAGARQGMRILLDMIRVQGFTPAEMEEAAQKWGDQHPVQEFLIIVAESERDGRESRALAFEKQMAGGK